MATDLGLPGTEVTETKTTAIHPTTHLRFCRLERSQSVQNRTMDLMTVTQRMPLIEVRKEPLMITSDIPDIRPQRGMLHRRLRKTAAARPLDRSRRKAIREPPFRHFQSTIPILAIIQGRMSQRRPRIRNHDSGITGVPLMV